MSRGCMYANDTLTLVHKTEFGPRVGGTAREDQGHCPEVLPLDKIEGMQITSQLSQMCI